jgi:hypothetical protein
VSESLVLAEHFGCQCCWLTILFANHDIWSGARDWTAGVKRRSQWCALVAPRFCVLALSLMWSYYRYCVILSVTVIVVAHDLRGVGDGSVVRFFVVVKAGSGTEC